MLFNIEFVDNAEEDLVRRKLEKWCGIDKEKPSKWPEDNYDPTNVAKGILGRRLGRDKVLLSETDARVLYAVRNGTLVHFDVVEVINLYNECIFHHELDKVMEYIDERFKGG